MISVLVVDDSIVIRRLVCDALAGAPGITVVGTAANGVLAQQRVAQLRPDIVTMDIEMPEMNGIEAVRALRRAGERVPVIMFSTLTAAGAAATLDALAAGASDYVTKPSHTGSVQAAMAAVQAQLVPRIRALAATAAARRTAARRGAVSPAGAAHRVPPPAHPGGGLPARPASPPLAPRPFVASGKVDILAVGSSTGGPDALAAVLAALPAGLPVPVVIVQHMPPLFTSMLAERLDRATPPRVREAGDGDPLLPGHVYVAPGDRHLEVVRRGTHVCTRLTDAPPENSCRPAVDVLFRSVAAVYGAGALAAVLTGMGHDGRAGAQALRGAGAEIVAQDEDSSVVWGMPGAVVAAGLAHRVLPLSGIGSYLAARVPARTAVVR